MTASPSPLGDRARTVAAMIAENLREQILSGEIPVGARLQQNDVARRFDVSSTPVREAFAELRSQGLVTGTEHRGVRVFRPTLADVVEAAEVQELLEGPCIADSAPLLTDADLANARLLLDEHREVPPAERRLGVEIDTAFHTALLVRCPNAKLRGMAEAARRETAVHRLVLIPVDEPDEALVHAIHQQHEDIYAACADRDGPAAAARTVDHIRWSREVFREVLG